MTPRELIADELQTIDPRTPDLAGRILARLRYAGYVIVPGRPEDAPGGSGHAAAGRAIEAAWETNRA